MAAHSKHPVIRLLRLLAGTCFVWAVLAAVPAHAFDYGRGTYGSGAYNVGQLDPTTTVLVSGTNPATVGDSIRLTATVSPSTATGTVTFKNGSTTIGTAALGHASGSFTTSALTAGSHSLKAVYAGNLSHSGSTSNTVIQVVNAATVPAPSSSSSSTSTEGGTSGGGGGGGGRRTSGNISGSSSSSSAAAGSASSISSTAEGSSLLTVLIDRRTVTYRDVPLSAWFAPYVATLVEKDIARGYRDARGRLTGEFGVANPVTHAEILKMALQATGTPLSTGEPRNRSARGDWSAPYVKTAEEMHFSVYTLALDVRRPATRGEVIQTLLEAFAVPIVSGEHPFSDLRASAPHASAIATAYGLGIVTGDTDATGKVTGTVRPNDPINRAEVAKLVVWMMEALGK